MTLVGLGIALCAGIAVGWFILPTPPRIQSWWETKLGWTDRVK